MAPEPAELISALDDAGGLGLAFDRPGEGAPVRGPGVVRVGAHRSGPLPDVGLDDFDILISVDPRAPAPWVGVAPGDLTDSLTALVDAYWRQPLAATIAAQVLRMSLKVGFEEALTLESLAYSTLLASQGFRSWRGERPPRPRPPDHPSPRVALSRGADSGLVIRLSRPNARNAFDARMRDELAEALEFALVDPDVAPVILCGEGPNFSAGGDLDEFGRAGDPGLAHAIRTLRSATGLAHRLGTRLTARLHGACVGAGIEVPAAAHRVLARPGTSFRLPEVAMGLIPGAGGMASIPRRVGRQRACWLAITGAELGLDTALAWGLADAVDEGP